jgi:hypothetical protein
METIVCSTLVGDWPGSHSLGEHYARVMKRMVKPYKFVLFADRYVPEVDVVRTPSWLTGDGCKCKLFALAPHFTEGTRVIFTDLDNILVNLERVERVSLDRPTCLEDFGTGFITFAAGPQMADVWRAFEKSRRGHDDHWLMQYGGAALPKHVRDGDMSAPWRKNWYTWPQAAPGRVWSYKPRGSADRHLPLDPLPATLPAELDILFFWGAPRPHEVIAAWNPFSQK